MAEKCVLCLERHGIVASVFGGVQQCLEEAEQEPEASGDESSLFFLSSFPLASPPTIPSLLINSLSSKDKTSRFIQLVYSAKHH